jgi:hypothetical protein
VVYFWNSTSLLPSAASFLYAMTRTVVAAPRSRRTRTATQGGPLVAKSRTTGDWHFHDGTAWIKDTPPGYQAPQQAISTGLVRIGGVTKPGLNANSLRRICGLSILVHERHKGE